MKIVNMYPTVKINQFLGAGTPPQLWHNNQFSRSLTTTVMMIDNL